MNKNLLVKRNAIRLSPITAAYCSPFVSGLGDIDFLHSVSNKLGLHISASRDSLSLTGSSLDLVDESIKKDLDINFSIEEKAKECGTKSTIICCNRFTCGNMYHSTLQHLMLALKYKQNFGDNCLFVFTELTWAWSRDILAEALKGCNYSLDLKGDVLNRIKNPTYFMASNLNPHKSSENMYAFNQIKRSCFSLIEKYPVRIDKNFSKLFITRAKNSNRSPVNLEELENFLKDSGFNVVDFADYSTEQQLALTNNANNIICLHGAAMVNLIVANIGAQVLELGFAGRTCYETIFTPSVSYRRVDCIEKKVFKSGNSQGQKEAYFINIDLVKLTIKTFSRELLN